MMHRYSNPEIRDAIGYLSRNGEKISYICPWCHWKHTEYARGNIFSIRCQHSSNKYVKISQFSSAPFPTAELAAIRNMDLKEGDNGSR